MAFDLYRNVAVRYKFLLVFLLLMGILSAAGVYYLFVADSLAKSFVELEELQKNETLYTSLLAYNQESQQATQAFVISGDPIWDTAHTNASTKLEDALQSLINERTQDHETRVLLERFDEIHTQLLGTELLILARVRSGDLAGASALFDQNYNNLQAETTNLIEEVVSRETQEVAKVFASNRLLLMVAQRTFLILLAILIIFGSAISFVGASMVADPIIELARVARAIAGGALSQRAAVTSRDEVGQLAASFNSMASNVQRLLEDAKLKSEKLRVQNVELEHTKVNLEEAVVHLQQLDKVKSEFVSVAAHQLRTPLTGIKWSLHALLEGNIGKLNATQNKIVRESLKVAMNLVVLVNDLLNVARLEEKRLGFIFEEQPFMPLVVKLVDLFTKRAERKGLTLVFNPPTSDIAPFLMDETRISVVMENLLDNAIKYTPPGGKITLTVVKQKKFVVVTLADTGIGIAENQYSRVFSKFFRSKNAQLSETSGTGLGLYVAKKIVEHHGGKMTFSSKEGKGSVFTFTLPLAGPPTLKQRGPKREKFG